MKSLGKFSFIMHPITKILHWILRTKIHISSSPSLPKKEIKYHFIKKQDFIVILPPPEGNSWQGIRASTQQFFAKEKMVFFPERLEKNQIKKIIDEIEKNEIKKIIFSGITDSYLKLIKSLKQNGSKSQIYVLYHGSFTQLSNDFDLIIFNKMIEALRDKEIDRIGFFKRDVARYFKIQNLPSFELINKINLPLARTPRKLPQAKINVCLMSNTGWIKNIYNQVIGFSMIPDLILHVQDKKFFIGLENTVKMQEHGTLSPKDFITFLDIIDICSYVSFSECSPMVPLECFSKGIPCLISPGTYLLDHDSELADYYMSIFSMIHLL